MADVVDVERLGRRLHRIRQERGLTLKKLSQQTGISIATLSRIERGGSKDVGAGTVIALTEWMGVDLEKFKEVPTPPSIRRTKTVETTPEIVELYLRADKNLSRKTATLLANLFRTAYVSLSKEMNGKD